MAEGVGAWVKAHKTGAAIAGVGGVGALALFVRSRSSSSGSSSGLFGGSASPAPAVGGAIDTSGIDAYNQLASAISSQNDQISQIQAELGSNAVAAVPASSGSGIMPPAVGAYVGSGYLPANPNQPVSGQSGGTYT